MNKSLKGVKNGFRSLDYDINKLYRAAKWGGLVDTTDFVDINDQLVIDGIVYEAVINVEYMLNGNRGNCSRLCSFFEETRGGCCKVQCVCQGVHYIWRRKDV